MKGSLDIHPSVKFVPVVLLSPLQLVEIMLDLGLVIDLKSTCMC